MRRADHHLVQQVLDGDLSAEEFEKFQQRLRDEPALAGLYSGYAQLHHTLCEEFEGGDVAVHDIGARPSSRYRIPVMAGLVALPVIAALVVWLRPWSAGAGGKDVATIAFSMDAVWQIEGAVRKTSDSTGVEKGGVLHLQQGRAEISIKPSSTALIEAPADLTFVSGKSIQLTRGRGFFQIGEAGGGLEITTPVLHVDGPGAGIGIEVIPDRPTEIHVVTGKADVRSSRSKEGAVLSAGEAVRVPAGGGIERLSADGQRFATRLGRFRFVVAGPFDKTEWRTEYGKPMISETLVEGVNFAIFLRLPEIESPDTARVLLATLEVGRTTEGEFHTDGWAGMSFFSKGTEMLFFGDSFGPKETWSLDVKQRIPLIYPERAVSGPRVVTLRYDLRTGVVSLHEGGVPLRAPFCVGTIPPEIRFDEIRLGASSGAALAVKSLEIRIGGE